MIDIYNELDFGNTCCLGYFPGKLNIIAIESFKDFALTYTDDNMFQYIPSTPVVRVEVAISTRLGKKMLSTVVEKGCKEKLKRLTDANPYNVVSFESLIWYPDTKKTSFLTTYFSKPIPESVLQVIEERIKELGPDHYEVYVGFNYTPKQLCYMPKKDSPYLVAALELNYYFGPYVVLENIHAKGTKSRIIKDEITLPESLQKKRRDLFLDTKSILRLKGTEIL